MNLLSSKKNLLSKVCILLIVMYWVSSFVANKRWDKNPIVWDVVSYYDYLPAVFIYKDITMHFIEKNPNFFVLKFWPETAHNGGKVIKTAMGVSFLYAPFFFLGHLYAGIANEPQDGFSVPYQVFLQFGTLIYLIIGFIFLRKLLLNYFSDKIVSLVIFSLFFGTNLLYYATAEALMAHAYVFFVSCLFLWSTVKWHSNPTKKISALLGFTGGLLVIIRPNLILFILFPVLYGITDLHSAKEKLHLLKNNLGKAFIILLCFILPGIPQLIYWKYITGEWLYFSYTGDRFFCNNPHIMAGLFGYRNGWLLYTPIMLFGIIGIFLMKEKIKQMRLPILIILVIFIYVLHCWWAWWHGGFGLRAYIDIYSLLAITMASCYNFFLSKKNLVRGVILTVATLLISLNVFQEWQYENGYITCASMTKKSYWLSFLKTDVPGTFWQCLKEPDIESAHMGLPEYENEKMLLHTTIKELNFENSVEKENAFYSTSVAASGKYSLLLNQQHSFSPALSLRAEEILKDTTTGKRMASVKFFSKSEVGVKENLLALTFTCDTGVYFYKDLDFYCVESTPGKWSNISLEIPTSAIRSKSDTVKIFVWLPNTDKEIFIDDLKYEILREK
ncbi:MAG: hypothetical protein HY063_02055 [Bacteroidetes bacterium]|nr:hypothetical protein [Bacteroidota bacterium]